MALSVRGLAARRLTEVLRGGRSVSAVLAPRPEDPTGSDRALLAELVQGVLRDYPRLRYHLDQRLERPLKRRDQDLEALLLVGLYQLLAMRVPAYAAVQETVAGTRYLGKPWASRLVNGLLRRAARALEAGDLAPEAPELPEAVRFAHPAWLLEAWQRDWPAAWEAIARAGNERPPFTLRVNRTALARADYQARLAAAGHPATPHPLVPTALTREAPCPVEDLPGFGAGWVSVQDAAAQLAAPLLDPQPGERILDACAAPGGKTGHLLEWLGGRAAGLTALDREAERLQRVAEHIDRLAPATRPTILAGDLGAPDDWWDGDPFDRILLDAPCSGTGVIRRHPDIKVLRRAADIPALVAAQDRLLDGAWRVLAPGGRLVYATCSSLQAENEARIAAFLARTPDATDAPLDPQPAWGQARPHGRQILPTPGGMDGFYYAVLQKRGCAQGGLYPTGSGVA